MTTVQRSGPPSRSVVADHDLLAHVCGAFGGARVQRIERALSRFATSATIEDVRVHLVDGSVALLVLKDVTPAALLQGADAGKPSFLARRGVELTAYRTLLSDVPSLATCHAAVDDGDVSWLLLEKVPGVELYQVGELDLWVASAAAVAGLHRDLTRRLHAVPELSALLLRQDARHLSRWMSRAVSFAARRGGPRLSAIKALSAVHPRVVNRLAGLPQVLLHGDLYASNVLVVAGDPPRICPVDWELASLGPAVLDLAALVSGGWSDAERDAMVSAYWSAMRDPRWQPSRSEFAEALDLARLHLCVQWLGWAPDWKPPEEHAQDWLGEAQKLARRLFG